MAKGFQNELEKAVNASAVEDWDYVSASEPNHEKWGSAVSR